MVESDPTVGGYRVSSITLVYLSSSKSASLPTRTLTSYHCTLMTNPVQIIVIPTDDIQVQRAGPN